jgi:DNA topoisomerase-1
VVAEASGISILTVASQQFYYAGAMPASLDTLIELYSDNKTCAKLVGLDYVESDSAGLTRLKRGKGFSYLDDQEQIIIDKNLKHRIAELVIPPAWKEVWICPSDSGHVLATGIDEKGRKQYIYHPKWRTMRDLIKFYRMIVFAKSLNNIRREIGKNLLYDDFSKEKILAVMLWILDNTYIRIGNDIYFQENESIGLTTLTDKNVVVAGPVITFTFKAKSGKQQQLILEDPLIAEVIEQLRQVKGSRLFRYRVDDQWKEIVADDINHYLHEITGTQISAKDFRTWGGTLLAFLRLAQEAETERTKKTEKVVVEAVDQAAAVLGNTRAVAKSSYIHPDILDAYGSKYFDKHYSQAKKKPKHAGLDRRESELLYFLEQLFETEFKLLKG